MLQTKKTERERERDFSRTEGTRSRGQKRVGTYLTVPYLTGIYLTRYVGRQSILVPWD